MLCSSSAKDRFNKQLIFSSLRLKHCSYADATDVTVIAVSVVVVHLNPLKDEARRNNVKNSVLTSKKSHDIVAYIPAAKRWLYEQRRYYVTPTTYTHA